MPARKLRVVVDARIPAEGWGGVQQVAIGLAVGLTTIAPPDVEVLYTCFPEARDWLLPYIESAAQLKFVPAPPVSVPGKSWLGRKVPLVAGSIERAIVQPGWMTRIRVRIVQETGACEPGRADPRAAACPRR